MATGVCNLYNVSVSMAFGRNDTGVYTCIAYNSIGNDTRTTNITVNCKELAEVLSYPCCNVTVF